MHRYSAGPVPIGAAEPRNEYDLDALLHPAQALAHPNDVVNDPDLTLSEKRAILASWASDACAVEAAPALRRPPGSNPVAFRRHHGRVARARSADTRSVQARAALSARVGRTSSRRPHPQIA
jgi:hypothetical protein